MRTKPKPRCPLCYGRGIMIKNNRFTICPCTPKATHLGFIAKPEMNRAALALIDTKDCIVKDPNG